MDGLGHLLNIKGIRAPTAASKTKLDQLLRGNHHNYGVLWNDQKFHNHMPHILCSAYFLGASPTQLAAIFEECCKPLVEWQEDDVEEIMIEDWYTFLGDKRHERAFKDFYDDAIGDANFDWMTVVHTFLHNDHDRKHNLLFSLVGGLLHPLIHLGYAFEVNDANLASEALVLASTESPSYLPLVANPENIIKFPVKAGKKPLDFFLDLRNDSNFDGYYEKPLDGTIPELLADKYQDIFPYVFGLDISDYAKTLNDLLSLSSLLLTATHVPHKDPVFSFALLHLLTGTHAACEILLSPKISKVLPETQERQDLIRGLWLNYIVLYIRQLRPKFDHNRVLEYDFQSQPEIADLITSGGGLITRDDMWKRAVFLALNSEGKFDEHYVKAIRSLAFAETQLAPVGDYLVEGDFFAKAALMFAIEKPKHAYARGDITSLDVLN
ncbi:hypothetical protein NADFUDRAFT_45846 [Nadsonia fulvescens var. elongata DSM 6958]|uniref:Uncharacterized protein n=1 Tax=Nadsonia fulvescens var. elongata DSM 6958 TaxID=857566 RepID=A0A1E3PN39_9ASCO|nr:hypothetical protein NADFUDRAFT_45846 [Nadsonia fulvescens var. elongata DSM 6958]